MIALLAALLAVVSSPYSPPSYACDGVTSAYVVNFSYQASSDLAVTSTTPAGIATTLMQGTDWSVNLSSTSSTATLTLTSPGTKCPTGNVLKIARATALTQPTGFRQQTTYNPALHETAIDRAVMEIQQVNDRVVGTGTPASTAYVDAAVVATLTGGTVVQPITWNLTGDGVATTFSIPNATVNSPDLYIVTIDGVFQRPTTDYTVSTSPAQVVFASVPALNGVISVRSIGYARALSVGDNTQVLVTGTSVPVALKDLLANVVRPRSFGSDPTGVSDSTAAINAAITFCKTQNILGDGVALGGCTVDLGPGIFKVCSVNMSNATSKFYQNVSLRGAGRWATTLVPCGTGNIIIDMIGTNHSEVRDLSIDSASFISQTGIFLSRSTTATQANNNRIFDVHVFGNFSKAAVVSLSAESTSWERVRFENAGGVGGPAGDYVTFYTSDDNSQIGISSPNGTPLTSSNTDNTMVDCEFYSSNHDGATLSYFNNTAGYRFFGSTWVAGTANNVKLMAFRAGPTIFNGPVDNFGPHFEVFGTNNTAIYLDDVGTNALFKGIRVYGGWFVTSGTPAFVDYDRTLTASQAVLVDSMFSGIKLPPASPDLPIYAYGVENSTIYHMPRDGTGSLRIFGYQQDSLLKASTYYVSGTPVRTQIEQFASAVPITGTYAAGQRIWHTAPAPNTPLGWLAYGPVTLGTLNASATTGGCTNGANTLTLNSATGLNVGERINIAGIAGPRIVTSLVGTTAKLLTTCNATVVGAAVSYDASLGGIVPFGTVGNGTSGVGLVSVTQASLGTPGNGTLYYCSDCTIANPCAGGGTGALAKRLNGVWVCN